MLEALIGSFLLNSCFPAAFNLLHYLKFTPVNWSTIQKDRQFNVTAPWFRFLQSGLGLTLDFDKLSLNSNVNRSQLSPLLTKWQLEYIYPLCTLNRLYQETNGLIKPKLGQINNVSSFGLNHGDTINRTKLSTMIDKLMIDCLNQLNDELGPLQSILGYKFKQIVHLIEALTHPSSNYSKVWGNYERFFGFFSI